MKWRRTKCTTTYELRDFASEEMPGISVFYKDKTSHIFHTYSSYGRGGDLLIGTYNYLDLAPLGRQEEKGHGMDWVRHHDKYAEATRLYQAKLDDSSVSKDGIFPTWNWAEKLGAHGGQSVAATLPILETRQRLNLPARMSQRGFIGQIKRMFLLLSDDPPKKSCRVLRSGFGYGQRLEPQGERGVFQVKNYQSSSSSVRTETVFGPPDLLALNHHVANGATDNKDCDGDGNGNTGSRVHGYSNHRRNALVLRKW
jgi:hypothetical protein